MTMMMIDGDYDGMSMAMMMMLTMTVMMAIITHTIAIIFIIVITIAGVIVIVMRGRAIYGLRPTVRGINLLGKSYRARQGCLQTWICKKLDSIYELMCLDQAVHICVNLVQTGLPFGKKNGIVPL